MPPPNVSRKEVNSGGIGNPAPEGASADTVAHMDPDELIYSALGVSAIVRPHNRPKAAAARLVRRIPKEDWQQADRDCLEEHARLVIEVLVRDF